MSVTIKCLKLNSDDDLVTERQTYFFEDQAGEISCEHLEKRASFITYEILRQGKKIGTNILEYCHDGKVYSHIQFLLIHPVSSGELTMVIKSGTNYSLTLDCGDAIAPDAPEWESKLIAQIKAQMGNRSCNQPKVGTAGSHELFFHRTLGLFPEAIPSGTSLNEGFIKRERRQGKALLCLAYKI